MQFGTGVELYVPYTWRESRGTDATGVCREVHDTNKVVSRLMVMYTNIIKFGLAKTVQSTSMWLNALVVAYQPSLEKL